MTEQLSAMALRLAEAKKPCHICLGTGILKFSYPDPEVRDYTCIVCNGTREVYVLDDSVRVECIEKHTEPYGSRAYLMVQEATCEEASCRGWIPLDYRFGWEWMVALAKAEYPIGVKLNWDKLNWSAYEQKEVTFYYVIDTPGLAFFTAALRALGLEQVTNPH